MSESVAAPPPFIIELFRELQRREFALGYDDLLTLRTALRGGFGLGSRDELVELCVALWAKSRAEAATVRSLFTRVSPEDVAAWDTAAPAAGSVDVAAGATTGDASIPTLPAPVVDPAPIVAGHASVAIPALPPTSDRQMVFALQFPLSQRTVAQSFRRLRRPVRLGPAVELDVDATIARRSQAGVPVPPVLMPRRRNVARLLLFIDRQGSMAPFHPYLDHLRDAIVNDSALDRVWVAYFHDVAANPVDASILAPLEGTLFPALDPAMGAITPSRDGLVFRDPDLLDPMPLATLLDDVGDELGVVVLSDAGAARGNFDAGRNAATVAFFRALRVRRHRAMWLNPMPRALWAGSSAAQLARHLPMFPLDAPGLHRGIEVLRGRPASLERAA